RDFRTMRGSIMRTKWLLLSAIGLASLAVPACTPSGSTSPGSGTTAATAPVDVGAAHYPADKPEVIPPPEAFEQTVVIPNAVIRMDKKQTVSAEVDGRIEIIGTPLPLGAKVDPNDRDIYYEPNDKDKQLPYRRLRIANIVNK